MRNKTFIGIHPSGMASRNPVHFIKISDNFPYNFTDSDIKIAIALIKALQTKWTMPTGCPYMGYGVRGVWTHFGFGICDCGIFVNLEKCPISFGVQYSKFGFADINTNWASFG